MMFSDAEYLEQDIPTEEQNTSEEEEITPYDFM